MKKIVIALLIAGTCVVAGSTTLNAGEVSAFSVPPIPDWTTWRCEKVHLAQEIIETYGCSGPDGGRTSRILLKVKGAEKPFLIGWGYDDEAPNAAANAYAALYKNGKWIVGARGTGFTTEESGASITFYVFLNEEFSVREKVEIIVPQVDKEAESVTEVTSSSGNGITPSPTDRTRKEISIIMFRDMKEINT